MILKAEDLMVGDLVLLMESYGVEKTEVLRVTALDLYRIDQGDLKVASLDLTPEVLEKNGFAQCGEGTDYPQYNECTWIQERGMNKILLLEYIGWSRGYYSVHLSGSDSSITTINSIHELQHVIKVAKIKKEIII